MGYRLNGRGSIPGRGKKVFSIPQSSDKVWGPPSLLTNEYRRILSPEIKQPGSEARHSPPSSAEANNGGATPPPPYVFIEWCLIV
jgi:hypothetical protein